MRRNRMPPCVFARTQRNKRNSTLDIPRIFTISESEHRIHNPFTEEKYATLGRVLRIVDMRFITTLAGLRDK